MAAKRAMIATTIISSINVNPWTVRGMGLSFGFECSIEQMQVTRQFGLKSAILCMQCPEM